MMKKIDCSVCFITTHFPPGEMEDYCKWCKEKNGLFYDPDLTDLKGHVAVANAFCRRLKNEDNMH